MASTYSTNLRLELIGTGEQQGTWGATTNKNLGTLIEQAICGYESVTVSNSGDTTLTSVDGASDQSRNVVLNLTGTITAARNVICPAIEKLYVVKNATSGGFAVTFKVSGQTGVTIPNGSTVFLYVDGTDVRSVTGSLALQSANSVSITGGTITGITDIAIADGGTGASDAATARTNLGLAIGTNVQAYDATLQSLSGLGTASDRYAYTTGVDTWAEGTITSAGRAILDDASASDQRTTLGLGTAATFNVGTSANNVVQLDGTAKLPAVDGSQLTNLPVQSSSGRLLRAPQILTSGNSYTTPAGCNAIYVEVVGGGGGGGLAYSETTGAAVSAGGGGSGAYSAKYFPVSASTSYSYTIGAGGLGSTSISTPDGSSGGQSTFTVGTTIVTAGGGVGGKGLRSSGDVSAGGGNGGSASNGDLNVRGAGGSPGGISGSAGGTGGSSFFGGGGAYGSAGVLGGGGAGGSAVNTIESGQNGGAGLIRIWEYS